MQGKTINNALIALRKDMLADGGDGLEHVEALLALRGVPLPHYNWIVRDRIKRGLMRQIVLPALRDGPKTTADLVALVAQEDTGWPDDVVQSRTVGWLKMMRCEGVVGGTKGVWWLALESRSLEPS